MGSLNDCLRWELTFKTRHSEKPSLDGRFTHGSGRQLITWRRAAGDLKQSLVVGHRTVNILSLMRILRALVYSIGFGIAVTVAAAIALGLINIYLTGHGNTLFQEDVFDGPILYGGYDDLILIGLSSSTIVISFIVFYRSKTH